MGQAEVLNYLKVLRCTGSEDFVKARDIIKGLKDQGATNGSLEKVRANLVKLEVFGFIEGRIDSKNGNWLRVWRYRNTGKNVQK